MVRHGISRNDWNTTPMWGPGTGGCPPTRISPASGRMRPLMSLIRVVLPQPDGPTRVTKEFGRMSSVMPLRACTVTGDFSRRNHFDTLRSAITAFASGFSETSAARRVMTGPLSPANRIDRRRGAAVGEHGVDEARVDPIPGGNPLELPPLRVLVEGVGREGESGHVESAIHRPVPAVAFGERLEIGALHVGPRFRHRLDPHLLIGGKGPRGHHDAPHDRMDVLAPGPRHLLGH